MIIQFHTFISQVDVPASCSNPLSAPVDNGAGETYGVGSRCIEHGQSWTRTSGGVVSTNSNGIGCYQVRSCSSI